MSKVAPTLLVIFGATLVAALTGCSAGPLPGGTLAASGGSSATTTSANQPASGSGAQTLSQVPRECPTTADVEAEVGLALKNPTFTRNSTVINCKYGTDNTSNMVQINFLHPSNNVTSGDLQAYVASIAAGGDDTMTEVHGLGRAAYALASPNDNGAAIVLLNNHIQLTVIAFTGDLSAVERVAQGCLTEK